MTQGFLQVSFMQRGCALGDKRGQVSVRGRGLLAILMVVVRHIRFLAGMGLVISPLPSGKSCA